MAKAFIFGAIAVLCVIQGVMCDFPDPMVFFKDNMTNGEISRLVWQHRVNNKAAFENALKNDSVHLLEVDVMLDNNGKPVLQHDADQKIDFTLDQLLDALKKNQTKGIKFDFKKPEALEASIKPIKDANLSVPVFINADILRGPGGSEPTFHNFVDKVLANFSTSVLSPGWTTGAANASYTSKQLAGMLEAVKNFPGLKTYPVRASLIQFTNATEFKDLLKEKSSTLTIWTVTDEKYNISSVKTFVKAIGRNRVYLDLPKDQQDKINGSSNIAVNSLMILGVIFSYFMLF